MIKKLLNRLNKLISIITKKQSSYDYDYNFYKRDKIEEYLSRSVDTYELEFRIRELDRKGAFNRF